MESEVNRSYELEGDFDEGFEVILYEDGEESGRGFFHDFDEAESFGEDWL